MRVGVLWLFLMVPWVSDRGILDHIHLLFRHIWHFGKSLRPDFMMPFWTVFCLFGLFKEGGILSVTAYEYYVNLHYVSSVCP